MLLLPSTVELLLVHAFLLKCNRAFSCMYVFSLTAVTDIHTPAGLKAAPGSWDRWPVLASLPLLSAAEAEQESERARRQVASARQGLWVWMCMRVHVWMCFYRDSVWCYYSV